MNEPRIEIAYVASHPRPWHVTLRRGTDQTVRFFESRSGAMVVIGQWLEELMPEETHVDA